jgi:hypothetical protein
MEKGKSPERLSRRFCFFGGMSVAWGGEIREEGVAYVL